jgi:hypothetical protein
MKHSELKTLLREQIYQSHLSILNETIVSDIMSLILSPKVKKAMKALRADPDFIELERQAKIAKEELEAINKRIESNLTRREKVIQDMKKSGIKVDPDMDSVQMFRAYQDWSDNIDKHIKARGTKATWEKFFNKK